MTLRIGDLVPDVELIDHDGRPWLLSTHRGRPVVLVLVVTLIWSVLSFLDNATSEKQSDIKLASATSSHCHLTG